MDWACVPVAASASVPVSISVHRILVVDMGFFTIYVAPSARALVEARALPK